MTADHFSVIGFRARSAEELAELVTRLPEDGGHSQPCGPGLYYRWRAASGSELWIHMQRESEGGFSIVGVTPFFAGRGRMPVRVMKKRQRPFDNAFEGAVFVEIEPGPRPHQCATVALFDVVDYACWANRVCPFLAQAQITAFPHDIAIFADEDMFAANQQGQTVKFAPESFFASGLFSGPGDGAGPAVFHDPSDENFEAASRAFFTGRVIEAHMLRNDVTGQEFHSALVKTLGGTLDLVADRTQIRADLQPGNIVQGEFWLCGRLIEGNGHA
jgi:hypothetical protein